MGARTFNKCINPDVMDRLSIFKWLYIAHGSPSLGAALYENIFRARSADLFLCSKYTGGGNWGHARGRRCADKWIAVEMCWGGAGG